MTKMAESNNKNNSSSTIDATTIIITRSADDGKHNNSNIKRRNSSVHVCRSRRLYVIVILGIYVLFSSKFLSDVITRSSTLYIPSNNRLVTDNISYELIRSYHVKPTDEDEGQILSIIKGLESKNKIEENHEYKRLMKHIKVIKQAYEDLLMNDSSSSSSSSSSSDTRTRSINKNIVYIQEEEGEEEEVQLQEVPTFTKSTNHKSDRNSSNKNNNHLYEYFFEGWERYVDIDAPLDWKILTLSSFCDCNEDDGKGREFNMNSEGDSGSSKLSSVSADVIRRLYRIRASKIFAKGKGDTWVHWSPYYSSTNSKGLKAYLINRKGMESVINFVNNIDGMNQLKQTWTNRLIACNNHGGGNNHNCAFLPEEGLFYHAMKMTTATTTKVADSSSLLTMWDGGVYSSTVPCVTTTKHRDIPSNYDMNGRQDEDDVGAAAATATATIVTSSYSSSAAEYSMTTIRRGNEETNMVEEKNDFDTGSILIITSMRIKNYNDFIQNMNWIYADSKELIKVHATNNGDRNNIVLDDHDNNKDNNNHSNNNVRWQIKVVVTHKQLLGPIEKCIEDNFNRNSVLNFVVVVNEQKFNKFVWVSENIHLMSQYDKVLMTDSDIRIAGSAYKTFLRKSSSSLIASPIREGLDTSLFHQRRNFDYSFNDLIFGGDARSWMGIGKDKKKKKKQTRWKLEQFGVVNAFEVGFTDVYFVLFDSQFASWFFPQVLTDDYLNKYISDWGVPNIWCGAAKQYNPNLTSCALVTTSNIHGDTKSIGWQGLDSYIDEGRLIQENLKKDFKEWFTYSIWPIIQYCTINGEDEGGGEQALVNEDIQFNITKKNDECYDNLGNSIN